MTDSRCLAPAKFGVDWFAPSGSAEDLTRTYLSTNNLDKVMSRVMGEARPAVVSILHWRGEIGKRVMKEVLTQPDNWLQSPREPRWSSRRVVLEGEIWLSKFRDREWLSALSDLCWGQLESDLVMKDSFKEPPLENDRDCFSLVLEYGLFASEQSICQAWEDWGRVRLSLNSSRSSSYPVWLPVMVSFSSPVDAAGKVCSGVCLAVCSWGKHRKFQWESHLHLFLISFWESHIWLPV